MSVEKSAGAIIFRKENGKIYYLLLNYSALSGKGKTYWGFSKGHIEQGEKTGETIRREVREETGIRDIRFIKGFKSLEKYFFRNKEKTIFKTVFYLLAQTKTKEIKISFEHIGYRWLPYEQALRQLTFKNAKGIIKKANDFLSEKSIRDS
ncbi:MAG: NUDIX domain-containing protein [Patescibacteria group bacterium]